MGLINRSQDLRARLSRIGIDCDHLAARIALEATVEPWPKNGGAVQFWAAVPAL